MGRMTEWRNHFYTEEPPLSVIFVEMKHYGGGTSVAGSASSQIYRLQGGHGRQLQWNRASMSKPPLPSELIIESPTPALVADT